MRDFLFRVAVQQRLHRGGGRQAFIQHRVDLLHDRHVDAVTGGEGLRGQRGAQTLDRLADLGAGRLGREAARER